MTKRETKIVKKPWGQEEWIDLNDRYCFKKISINAGHRTSFQYHEHKHETVYFTEGEAEVWLEDEETGEIVKSVFRAGDSFVVAPPRKHRVLPITDVVLFEASTPEVDDVIRIQDDTDRGDGRIDDEHK